MQPQGTGWSNPATAEIADAIRADPVLLMETLDRINHLAAGMGFDETITEAGREVAATWYGQERMPPRHADIDWQQLGESFVVQVLGRGRELGR